MLRPRRPCLRSREPISRSRLHSGVGEEAPGASLAIGLGVLEGLNENTSDHTLKLSIEVNF
jgi:hypothetical protein